MPPRNFADFAGPAGPYRDKRVIAIAADDYERAGGFVVQAGSAGDVTYRTIDGDDDQTETLAIGDTIVGGGGVPVLIKVVRGTSTVNSIIASFL